MIVPKQGIGEIVANYSKIEGIFLRRAFLCNSPRGIICQYFLQIVKVGYAFISGLILISVS